MENENTSFELEKKNGEGKVRKYHGERNFLWTARHQRLYKALVKRSSGPKKDPEEEETIEEPVLFLLFS